LTIGFCKSFLPGFTLDALCAQLRDALRNRAAPHTQCIRRQTTPTAAMLKSSGEAETVVSCDLGAADCSWS